MNRYDDHNVNTPKRIASEFPSRTRMAVTVINTDMIEKNTIISIPSMKWPNLFLEWSFIPMPVKSSSLHAVQLSYFLE